MSEFDPLAVLAATVVAFFLSSTYYAIFGERLAEVSDAAARGERPPPWKLGVELIRSLTVAAVVAGLAAGVTWTTGPAASCSASSSGSASRSCCGWARSSGRTRPGRLP